MPELHGIRIIVTRSADDCGDWAAQLEQAGARAIVLPCITAEIIDTPSLRTALKADIAVANWLVLTSQRGVDAFATLNPAPLPAAVQVAVVGPATGDAARARLGRVDHISTGTAAALWGSLAADVRFANTPRCVLALAANASAQLQDRLAQAGARCARYDVYRTVPSAPLRRKQPLSALHADKILFSSPTAVEGFVNQVELDTAAGVVTIGPSTSAAARSYGLIVEAQAREPSLQGLMEAIHG